MKKISFLFIYILSIPLNAQNWINCTNGFHVNDMIQESNILWVGTTGGLVEKNLETGETQFFTRGDSPIPSNDVRSLAIDSENNLWLSTNQGTAIFDGENWTLFYDKSGLVKMDNDGRMMVAESDSIHWWTGQNFESIEFPFFNYYSLTDIETDPSDDAVWLTFYTFGQYALYRYKDQEFELFDYNNSPLPNGSPSFNPLKLDNENRLWVGNEAGLFRYENEEWFEFSNEVNGFPQGEISAIGTSSEGNVWAIIAFNTVGLNGYLVEIKSDDSFTIYDLPEAINMETRFGDIAVLDSPSPRIMIGTFHFGMWEYDLNSWNEVPTSQSAALSNNICQIFIDGSTIYFTSGRNFYYQGNIMFSINEGDWAFYSDYSVPFSIDEGHPVNIVEKGNNDTLWIHSNDTLFTFTNGLWDVPQQPDILNDVLEINSFIHYDLNGNRWLLEKWESYLFFESNQGWLVFDYEEHGAVSGIYEAYFTHPNTGDFWLASANGISRYDGENWTIIRPSELPGLDADWVYNMKVDDNGIVWANTVQGILRIENNIPEIFVTEIPGYSEYAFRNFALDAQNNLWVGLDNAVAKFNGINWEVFDITNSGVPNGLIREMDFDESGNLWMGSSSGGFAVYNENGLPDYFFEDFHVGINYPSELNKKTDFTISPNPVLKEETLRLKLSDNFLIDKSTSISMFNNLGQLLKSFPVVNRDVTIRIDMIGITCWYLLFASSKQFNICHTKDHCVLMSNGLF